MRIQLLLQAFLLCVAGNAVYSQAGWINVSAEYAPLPKTIQVFKKSDSLNGRPFIGYYVIADLKDKSIDFTTETGDGKRFTPSQYFLRHDSPIVVVNSTLFSFATNQNLNVIIR